MVSVGRWSYIQGVALSQRCPMGCLHTVVFTDRWSLDRFTVLTPSPFRLHHYSCLLLPVSSFSELFPWERISLLVEYNLTASDNGGTVHRSAITGHASYLDRHASLLEKYKHIDVYTLKGAGSKNTPAVTGPRVTLRPGRILVWHSQPILALSFLGTNAQ